MSIKPIYFTVNGMASHGWVHLDDAARQRIPKVPFHWYRDTSATGGQNLP